jgi:feruloyl esterase
MNSTRTAVTQTPFCRLEGYANPSPRSHSEFEVWLPARAAWNGRFLGVGAGGSMGDVNRPDLIGAVSRSRGSTSVVRRVPVTDQKKN